MDEQSVNTILRGWVAASLLVGLAFILIGQPILGVIGVTLVILGLMSIMFVVGLHFGTLEEVGS